MAKLTLIADREFERDYSLSNGNRITLILEEDFSMISFADSNGKKLSGEFEFVESEHNNTYLLSRMYVPIKNEGIGRACLEFFMAVSGAEIYTRPHDGIVRDDGSHLTENAPGFVLKMQKEGLISNDEDDTYYDDEG